jgi:mannose/fructose/N-acetylgalactosamine-specific phosphotransferase system component IID
VFRVIRYALFFQVNSNVSHMNYAKMASRTMKKLIAFIQNVATGKVVLGFFIPAMVVYATMLLYTIPKVEQYAPGMKLFDLSPTGYSFPYAIELLSVLGVKGRDLYLYQQLPIDFLYPGLFAVSCCMLLAWLFSKSLNSNSKMFYLCFVPVAAGLFDYLENIGIVQMLMSYPNVAESHVAITSALTILKSVCTSTFFLTLLLGVVFFLKHRRT